ncbi:MAG: hypothetical protein RL376_1874 [Verrucomicrobiota bacterium]|jgi:hypothetical protein
MKSSYIPTTLTLAALVLTATGCTAKREGSVVNTRQPGPAIGTAIGTVGGAVVGNAAGAVVGAGEGFSSASASAFDSQRRVVRTWRNETTSDGRTVRVPVEIEVDQYGRPYTNPVATKSASGETEAKGPR